MAGQNDGISLHVAWETIQWGLGIVGSTLAASVLWILHLGQRVSRLEAQVANLPDRRFIEEQTAALEARIDRLYDRH